MSRLSLPPRRTPSGVLLAVGMTVVLALVIWPCALRAEAPYGIDQRVPIGPYMNGELPPRANVETAHWTTVEAFPNLSFEDPTALMPMPRSNRLAVSSRQGKIVSFVNDPNTSELVEFLDLTNVTQGWDDCGLLGFAFHPEFGQADSPNRGYVYVWYHYSPHPIPGPRRPPVNTPGYNRLSRFTVPDGSQVADRATEQVLINQFDHNLWHDGSGMFFGLDGYLYLGVSDEGDAYDRFNNSQSLTNKIFSGALRIDVNCDPKKGHAIRRQPLQEDKLPEGFSELNYTANYFIPNDNPFLDKDGGKLEEFWAVGLRNPHRMTQDPATGRIWIGDIGQDKWEEVDILERGCNYQWVYMEGTHPSVDKGTPKLKPPADQLIGVEKPPLYEYCHGTEGKCVIGGYVYRGREFPELTGKYIFGDNGSGRLWAMSWDEKSPPTVEYLCHMPPGFNYTGLSSFGVDHQGEVYMCKMGRPSKLLKLARVDEKLATKSITFAAPERLSWMKAFDDLQNLTPVAGFVPYEVNSPLWSDGAVKRRWVAVPTGEQIKFSPTGEWSFPDGTVFIKHFDMVVNEVTGEKRRLETRFLVRQAGGGVYGVSYRWRGGERPEADLVSSPQTDRFTITTATGTRTQNWYFPSPLDCLVCHNPNAGDVLGVNARQLNRQFEYRDGENPVSDNQLRTLAHLGLFASAPSEAEIGKLAALVRVTDTSASVEQRARSYLDANCAQCHRPNGVQGYFDARYDTPLAEQGLINGRLSKNIDIEGAKVICPSDTSKSVLYQRLCLVGETQIPPLQMPPLARNVVDQDAVTLLEEWIKSLKKQ